MPTEILVKIFYSPTDTDGEIRPFASIAAAVDNCRGEGLQFGYVLEIETDEDTGLVRGRDVSEDFAVAWEKAENADAEESYPARCEWTRAEWVWSRSEHPKFRRPSVVPAMKSFSF